MNIHICIYIYIYIYIYTYIYICICLRPGGREPSLAARLRRGGDGWEDHAIVCVLN